MPTRLDATYIDADGDKVAPVMVHRAILGSLERFVGILIEEYAGDLPLWLSPIQASILNISNSQEEYCSDLCKKLNIRKIRTEMDLRNEKISYKIREHSMKRTPYLLIVGDKEVENDELSVRTRSGDDLGVMKVDKFIKMIETLVNDKSILLNK
jgi:threonyl-tRNA synthetase